MPSDEKRTVVTCEEAGLDEHDSLATIRHADDLLLAKLGYKSEFRRKISLIESTAIVLSILTPLASVTVTLPFPLASGGHVGMVYGWIIPCMFVMTVAASMAELTSAMPTSGGLYYFSARLAPRRWAPLACWITGWANVTGQVALMCSSDYLTAQMIATALEARSDGAVKLGLGPTYGLMIALLVSHGIVCSFKTSILARINVYYVVLNLGTLIALTVALLVCSGGQRVSAKTAFTSFENNTGWSNNGWAFLLSFYAPMWTMVGYDSAAHLSEETTGAARVAPIAIVSAVASTSLLGWLLFIAISFSTASIPRLLQTDFTIPAGQLYLDVLGKPGMLVVWSILIVLGYACGMAQGVDASRVIFAFSRDNALPGSKWWKRVHPGTRTPVNGVWLVMALSAILGLLSFSDAALTSLAGASVIALYTSYITPIFLRLTSGRHTFEPGPFSLGWWYMPIGSTAVAWTAFVIVLFLFPSGVNPTADTMNYTVVVIMGVFMFASLSWIFSARKWFKGPVRTIGTSTSDDSIAHDGEELEEKNEMRIEEREMSG
ncbi:amino acid transporter [Lentinus tigrinus ALCF2SS1-7]|uniref:Amino acid transporter n=1 Tax=Lentinus tigrinus ALCF2SS1-6 TaxID=1328759 RepID=A0A5C2SV51_9APHY|nr:amino acid transporter [Lentinus tigrinus ALCF2SS1-6]RPD81428.1 amino acid transporter [Lentinus tigrinus ALCF2SS1-7]